MDLAFDIEIATAVSAAIETLKVNDETAAYLVYQIPLPVYLFSRQMIPIA
jgi:hypothetical protein